MGGLLIYGALCLNGTNIIYRLNRALPATIYTVRFLQLYHLYSSLHILRSWNIYNILYIYGFHMDYIYMGLDYRFLRLPYIYIYIVFIYWVLQIFVSGTTYSS